MKKLFFCAVTVISIVLGFSACDTDILTGGVISCTLNENADNEYLCTETSESLCAATDCKCEGDTNNTAVQGTGCNSSWDGKCTNSAGSFYYYNLADQARIDALALICTNELMGSWSTR